MTFQPLLIGTTGNDGTGDSLRAGGDKINDNFAELYASLNGIFIKTLGAVGDGTTNDKAALDAAVTAALAAPHKTLILTTGTYAIASRWDIPSDLKVVGLGLKGSIILKYIGASGSSDLARATNRSNIWIENIVFDNNFGTAGGTNGNALELNNCDDITLVDVTCQDAADSGLAIVNGCNNIFTYGCNFSDNTTQEGVELRDSTNIFFKNVTVSRNGGFGIIAWNGCDGIFIDGFEGIDNAIESIGIRWQNNNGYITNFKIKGSNDNGISVSGTNFRVSNGYIEDCAYHGLCFYGDYNTATNVRASNVGLADNGLEYAAVAVNSAFGGRGSNNAILGCTGYDCDYGGKVSGGGYTTWTSGDSFTVTLASAVYRQFNNNLYEAVSIGSFTTATGQEPVHTSGDATGTDNITWRFIASAPSSYIGFRCHNNTYVGNNFNGNRVGKYSIENNNHFNSIVDEEFLRLSPRDSTSATENWCGIFAGGFTPENNVAAPIGSLFTRRNGTVPYRILYGKNLGTGNTGWRPVQLVVTGTTANRPTGLVSFETGSMYFDETIIRPVWWYNATSVYVDALGPAPTITTAGTTGNQTINNYSGSVNIATGQQTITVTNDRVTAGSVVVAQIATTDTTTWVTSVVPASGSFVISLNQVAPAERRINWWVR